MPSQSKRLTVHLADHASPVEVEIIRSARRTKTIGMQVSDGRIVVRAPLRTSDRTIQALVDQHSIRIQRWLTADAERRPEATWFTQPLLLFGSPHALQYRSASRWSFEIGDDVLHITGPAPTAHEEALKRALIGWLRQLAADDLRSRVTAWSRRIGVDVAKVQVKEQKTRWGSCSTRGNVNFNWRLVMAPPHVIDYVVVHELCHRMEMNHSSKFWRLVEHYLPDYQNARKWLKSYGQTLYF